MKKISTTAIGCISIFGFLVLEAHAQVPPLNDTADFASTRLPPHTMWNRVSTGLPALDLRINRYYDSRAVAGMICSGNNCSEINIVARGTNFKSYGKDFDRQFGLSTIGGTQIRSAECPGTDMLMTGISCSGTNCTSPTIYCAKFYGIRNDNCYWRSAFPSTGTDRWDILPKQQFVVGLRCNGPLCTENQLKACHVGPGSGAVGGVQRSGDIGFLISNLGANKYLGHDVGDTGSNPIKLYGNPLGDNVKFQLRQANIGTANGNLFYIITYDTGHCLNIEGGFHFAGMRAFKSACRPSFENYKFILRELQQGTFQILPNHNSTMCLEVSIDGMELVTQQPCDGTKSRQLFKFVQH